MHSGHIEALRGTMGSVWELCVHQGCSLFLPAIISALCTGWHMHHGP